MVFGWGKKRNESQVSEASSREERTISQSEIESVIESARKVRSKVLVAESTALRSKMESLFSEFNKTISKLDGDDLKIDDVDKNIRIIVERGKKQVIAIANEESAKSLPEISSREDVKKFVNEAKRRIKRTGDALGRHSRVINLFAKKYANRIKEIMKSLESDLQEAIKTFENEQEKDKIALEVLSDLQKLYKLQDTATSEIERAEKTDNECLKDTELLNKSQDEIDKIKSSGEYSSYIKELEKLKEHKLHVQSEHKKINEQFTKISRPLSKYEYVSAMDKERKILLGVLCNNPSSAFEEGNVDEIKAVLSAVRAGVMNGTVSVKDTDRATASIDQILALVSEFAKSYKMLETKRKDLAAKVSSMFDSNALESLEAEIERKKLFISDQKSRAEQMRKDARSASDAIPSARAKLQENLCSFTSVLYTVRD